MNCTANSKPNSVKLEKPANLLRRSLSLSLVVLALLVLLPGLGFSQDLQFGGFLNLEKRVNVGEIPDQGVPIEDFYNRFRLEMDASLGETLHAFSSIDIRFYDIPVVNSLNQMESPNQLFPVEEASLWEAYVDVYEFLLPDLDLRVGKQRIVWGTADTLNPTDNLNPDDFSDMLNFTEKIPSWAVQLSYYLGDFIFTGIWLPSFAPILLPRDRSSLFLGSAVSSFDHRIVMPEVKIENSMFALKAGGIVGPLDVSISYFNGYDDSPILRKLNLDTNALELGFYRMHVFGADFATEIAGIGFWGEGAVFLPNREVVSETIAGGVPTRNVELDFEPYGKYTLGFDYTFPFGLYINNQWMHGFFTERGTDGINDYFFISIEQPLFDNALEISLSTVVEIDDWSSIADNYGLGFFPEIRFVGIDNLEMAAGMFAADARPDTLFAAWKDLDQVFVRLKVSL